MLRHCRNDVGSGDDTDDALILQHRDGIDLAVGHHGKQFAKRCRCHGPWTDDIHHISRAYRLVSLAIKQAFECRQETATEIAAFIAGRLAILPESPDTQPPRPDEQEEAQAEDEVIAEADE